MKNPFKVKKDIKIGMKNIPDSIDFKFFDTIKKQNDDILAELINLKMSIERMRRMTKFKIIFGSTLITFVIITFLAVTTEYKEFILNLLGGLF